MPTIANLLSGVSLVAALAALIKSTHERRVASRLPIFELIQERFTRPDFSALILGVAVGSLAVLGPLGLAVAVGWAHPHFSGEITGTILFLGFGTVFVKVVWAALEELIFRGAMLPQVAKLTNGWWGLAVSSVLFSWGHLERTGARAPDVLSLLVFGLDGVGFGIAYLATRSLWMPTIWHAAKNACIWLVLGASTLELTHGVMDVTFSGPPLWVGAANQAGLLDTMASGIAAAVIAAVYWRPVRSGRTVGAESVRASRRGGRG